MSENRDRANLIQNDAMVSAIFAAITQASGEPEEKLKAVVRAGKIAEAFMCGSTLAFDAVVATLRVGAISASPSTQ